MITNVVYVNVKREFIEDFIEATKINHLNSVKESGNFRFDVIQNAENRSLFILYEAFNSEEDAAIHKKTPHYLKWRDTVAEWMEEPRTGVRYNMLFPEALAKIK